MWDCCSFFVPNAQDYSRTSLTFLFLFLIFLIPLLFNLIVSYFDSKRSSDLQISAVNMFSLCSVKTRLYQYLYGDYVRATNVNICIRLWSSYKICCYLDLFEVTDCWVWHYYFLHIIISRNIDTTICSPYHGSVTFCFKQLIVSLWILYRSGCKSNCGNDCEGARGRRLSHEFQR